MDSVRPLRAINWLEYTSRSILAHFPETQGFSDNLVQTLSLVFLRTLPASLSAAIVEILPSDIKASKFKPEQVNESLPDFSYVNFVDKIKEMLSHLDRGQRTQEDLSKKVSEIFLWAFAQELPPDIKENLNKVLPKDFRFRMDLFSSTMEESRVA